MYSHPRLTRKRVAPPLDGATAWLNSAPLAREQLGSRVVLYGFWTYTCINWLRTLPYVRAWTDKYGDRGLVVVGVHTPEFEFERDADNVQRAVRAQHIEFPVVLDSEYKIWRAFDNHYWPALYLAGADRVIRYEHFGEGQYTETEHAIQQLLSECDRDVADDSLVSPDPQGVELPADWDELATPESYLGSGRNGVVVPSVGMRFHSRDVHLVMAPVRQGRPVPFWVTLDGAAPGSAHGLDVDSSGAGVLAEARMYQLIRQPGHIEDRIIDVQFPDGGGRAFVFTFG